MVYLILISKWNNASGSAKIENISIVIIDPLTTVYSQQDRFYFVEFHFPFYPIRTEIHFKAYWDNKIVDLIKKQKLGIQ